MVVKSEPWTGLEAGSQGHHGRGQVSSGQQGLESKYKPYRKGFMRSKARKGKKPKNIGRKVVD